MCYKLRGHASELTHLKQSESTVLQKLCICWNPKTPDKAVFPDQTTIVKSSGLSLATVKRALLGLESKGYLTKSRERAKGGSWMRNRYLLNYHRIELECLATRWWLAKENSQKRKKLTSELESFGFDYLAFISNELEKSPQLKMSRHHSSKRPTKEVRTKEVSNTSYSNNKNIHDEHVLPEVTGNTDSSRTNRADSAPGDVIPGEGQAVLFTREDDPDLTWLDDGLSDFSTKH